jgi:hypothetical protein
VLRWLEELIDTFLKLARAWQTFPRRQHRILAQPNQPLFGVDSRRGLDIGFADDIIVHGILRCGRSQILVPES